MMKRIMDVAKAVISEFKEGFAKGYSQQKDGTIVNEVETNSSMVNQAHTDIIMNIVEPMIKASGLQVGLCVGYHTIPKDQQYFNIYWDQVHNMIVFSKVDDLVDSAVKLGLTAGEIFEITAAHELGHVRHSNMEPDLFGMTGRRASMQSELSRLTQELNMMESLTQSHIDDFTVAYSDMRVMILECEYRAWAYGAIYVSPELLDKYNDFNERNVNSYDELLEKEYTSIIDLFKTKLVEEVK